MSNTDLFHDNGAEFSADRKHRYKLWRIWDNSQPLVMFIGLNPSTANETDADATIRSVGRISRANGFGGFYMMNCWTYIATQPENLIIDPLNVLENDKMLMQVSKMCKFVVFAWGNFNIVTERGMDNRLQRMFPDAMCIAHNKNGSPKHPLYCKSESQLKKFSNQ